MCKMSPGFNYRLDSGTGCPKEARTHFGIFVRLFAHFVTHLRSHNINLAQMRKLDEERDTAARGLCFSVYYQLVTSLAKRQVTGAGFSPVLFRTRRTSRTGLHKFAQIPRVCSNFLRGFTKSPNLFKFPFLWVHMSDRAIKESHFTRQHKSQRVTFVTWKPCFSTSFFNSKMPLKSTSLSEWVKGNSVRFSFTNLTNQNDKIWLEV